MLKGAAKNYDAVFLLERQNFVKEKINANVEKKLNLIKECVPTDLHLSKG